MNSIFIEVLVILGLILLNGFLAMSEMAIVSSNRLRLQSLANSGKTGAKIALSLLQTPSRLFAAIQIGITLVGVLIGAFGGSTLSDKVGVMITEPIGSVLLSEYSQAMGLSLVVVTSTFLSLILGELVPKRLALAHPEKTAANVAPLIRFISILATPGVKFLAFTTDLVMRLFRLQHVANPLVTQEEVKLMVEQGTEAGVFDIGEETIIKRSLKLGSLSVAAIMTPRTKIVCFNHDELELNFVIEKMKQSRHSYFPVYKGNLDHIVGLLSAKHLLYSLKDQDRFSLQDALLSPLMIPESVSVVSALESFRDNNAHVAIVIDEYGGMAGMLTILDMMGAIFGAIPHPIEEGKQRFIRREDGSQLVDGMTSLHEFAEHFHVKLDQLAEDEDILTIAGLFMHQIGRIPREGDVVQLENLRLEIVDMDNRRVDKILVQSLETHSTRLV